MKLNDFVTNWPKTIALIVLTAILFWGYGCPPTVQSLTTPKKMITRPELQIELDTIIATAQYKLADLDKQEQFRDLIFKNALLMIEGGAINPLGVITMLAGLYGITRGAKDVKDKVKKKINNT